MNEKLIEVARPSEKMKAVTGEDIEMANRLKPLLEAFGLSLRKSKNTLGNLGISCELALARALRMDFEKRFAGAETGCSGYSAWHPEKGFDVHHYEGPIVYADLDEALLTDVQEKNEEDGTNNRNGWRATSVKVEVFR
jgi:hypothetical protein